MVRRRAAFLAVFLVLAGCRSASTVPTSPVPQPPTDTRVVWAHEAREFIDALVEADLDSLAYYLADSAVLEGPYGLPGLDSLHANLAHQLSRSEAAIEQVFVSRDGLAVESYLDTGRSSVISVLSVFAMREGRIHSESWGHAAEEMSWWAARDRAQALYGQYLAAWDSGEPARIEAVYGEGAQRTDGLFVDTPSLGPEAGGFGLGVEHLVGETRRFVPGHARAFLDDESPAVFATGRSMSATDPPRLHAIFDVVDLEGCALRLLATWELDGFRIAAEEIMYEVSGLRRCAIQRDVALPAGWWTGWAAPEPSPITGVVTARVDTGTGMVEIVNGSAVDIEYAKWGLERFAAAGLPGPRVATMAFPPTTLCEHSSEHETATGTQRHLGFAILHPTDSRVDICRDEVLICDGAVCSEFGEEARGGLLHELGHIWEYQNLDDDTRAAFLELLGLDIWSDGQLTWSRGEGVEAAAEIIAWGLMDEPTSLAPELEVDPDALAEAFRLLTGVEPLVLG